MREPEISVIIPAFNEATRLPPFAKRVTDYLEETFPARHELIVVDDGSSDKTADSVHKACANAIIIRQTRNTGKGGAVRTGVLASRGALVLFLDADGAAPIEEEFRLRQAILRGADMAIGVRATLQRGHVLRSWSWRRCEMELPAQNVRWEFNPFRFMFGRTFALLVEFLLGLNIRDTQCGFKMFRKEWAHFLFSRLKLRGFAFDVELLHLARRSGLIIADIPINWREIDGGKVSMLTDPILMGRDILRLAWQKHFSRGRV